MHEGVPAAEKYIIRTDVLYSHLVATLALGHSEGGTSVSPLFWLGGNPPTIIVYRISWHPYSNPRNLNVGPSKKDLEASQGGKTAF